MDILPIELKRHLLMTDIARVEEKGIAVVRDGFKFTAYPCGHIDERIVKDMNNKVHP